MLFKSFIRLEKMTFNNNFIIILGLFILLLGKSFAQDIFSDLNILIYVIK